MPSVFGRTKEYPFEDFLKEVWEIHPDDDDRGKRETNTSQVCKHIPIIEHLR
jgi:hypothetical protein